MYLVCLGDIPITIVGPALNSSQLPAGKTITYNVVDSQTIDFAIPHTILPAALVQQAGSGAIVTALMGVVTPTVGSQTGTFAQSTTTCVASAPPTGGTQATFTVTVTGGAVASIAVANAGSGYLTPPTLTVHDTANPTSTCAATTTMKLVGFTIVFGGTSSGDKFATAPTITFTGGGGTNAAGTLNLTSGVVTSGTVGVAGSGYTTVPAVVVAAAAGAVTKTVTVNLPRKHGRFVRLEAVNSGTGNASGATATWDIEA
jgi:hypothetical protein